MTNDRIERLGKLADALSPEEKAFLSSKVSPPPPPPDPQALKLAALSAVAPETRRFSWADILSNTRGCFVIISSDGGASFIPFDQAIYGHSHGKRVIVIDGIVYVVNPDRFVRRTRYPIFRSHRWPRVTYYGFFREGDPEQKDLVSGKTPDVTGAVVGAIINDKIVKDIMNPEKDIRPWLYIILGAIVGGMAVGLYFLSVH